MKKTAFHIIQLIALMLSVVYSSAQVAFHTIVSQGPVVAGESFQVQYVIENMNKEDEFFAPDFKEFRFVSGPNVYTGSALSTNGAKKLKNIVYTLATTRPGRFIIPGASARIGDKLIKSENVWLEVISKTEMQKNGKAHLQDTNEDYFLSPGEDPYAKMQRNLFMKVLVDKRSCFVGEPVTATFKLYSRLESRSDIVKNPGFYGFTVQDMINLDDKLINTENINGKTFDVHVVRKVQLYPLQPGSFSIDAMEVRNKVEFSKSLVSKKTEQEIAEGVYAHEEAEEKNNTVVVENSMHTEPVAITVKPSPEKNKPLDYNGATGSFKVIASLDKNELARNEEGNLIVTISGKGNFTQLSAPAIVWPAGIEGFDPTIKDSLDHQHSPLSGKRVFNFRFISAKAGNYIFPAISFSFFKPDSNIYKRIVTNPLTVHISKQKRKSNEAAKDLTNAVKRKGQLKWWLTGIGGLLIAAGVFYWVRKTKQVNIKQTSLEDTSSTISVARILQPAYTFSEADDKTFYTVLRNYVWEFFSQHYGLTGSSMNKGMLSKTMDDHAVDTKDKNQLLEILHQCETGVFTNAESNTDKKKLLEETKDVLKKLNDQ